MFAIQFCLIHVIGDTQRVFDLVVAYLRDRG